MLGEVCLLLGVWNVIEKATQQRTNTHRHRVKESSKWKKKHTKTPFISGEMFIFRSRLFCFLPLSFKDPRLTQAERVGTTPPWWVWKLKDGVYCFWRNPRIRRRFPATTVFLKCNLCLSFCRLLVYIGEFSNRTLLGFLSEIDIKCDALRSHRNCTVQDPLIFFKDAVSRNKLDMIQDNNKTLVA